MGMAVRPPREGASLSSSEEKTTLDPVCILTLLAFGHLLKVVNFDVLSPATEPLAVAANASPAHYSHPSSHED